MFQRLSTVYILLSHWPLAPNPSPLTLKALFWSFYVSFCTFYASLRLKRTVFTRLKTSIISVNPVILPALEFRRRGSNFSSCFRVLVAINPFNLRNLCPRYLRLINDLRVCKLLYNCREDSTTIESSLQNKLFMQNKANFQKVKLNVNRVLTRDYVQMDTWSSGKTKPIQTQYKPNSNPIQSQSNPISAQKMPKQTQYKAKQSQLNPISEAKKCCCV